MDTNRALATLRDGWARLERSQVLSNTAGNLLTISSALPGLPSSAAPAMASYPDGICDGLEDAVLAPLDCGSPLPNVNEAATTVCGTDGNAHWYGPSNGYANPGVMVVGGVVDRCPYGCESGLCLVAEFIGESAGARLAYADDRDPK
jgi:hypothetical protein